MLNYRLHTFKALCNTRSYSKTAELLHITQPAVTGHIKYLEREYNTKLFIYEKKQLSLTENGKMLLKFVMAMEANSEKIKKLLVKPQPQRRTLKFGATLTIGEFMMSDIISQYVRTYPNTNINLDVSNTTILLEKLKNGEIDFALIEGNFDKSYYAYKLLSYENFIAVAHKDYIDTPQNMLIESLCNIPIILRENGSGTRNVFEAVLSEHNLKISDFKSIIEVGDFTLIKKLLINKIGISFMYEEVVKEELKSKSLVKVNLKHFNVVREFNFVYLKNSIFEEEYIEFYNFCKSNGFKGI